MPNNESAIEVHGEDVEAAISAGLKKLGLHRDQVKIEILDEGRKGFLGLGGREAVVRLAPISRPEPKTETPPAPLTAEKTPAPPEETEPPVIETTPPAASELEATAPETAAPEPTPEAEQAAPEEEPDEQEQVALQVVGDLLSHMDIQARIAVRRTPADDLTGRQMLVLNLIGGEDIGRLVGARGEVLNDFQYLARLMAAHQLQARADFLLDINGYREERQTALASLARRMAKKAVRRGRPVTLEPMSPYDRRIIHMTLRQDDAVYTQSTGEGNRRRVRIYPQGYAED